MHNQDKEKNFVSAIVYLRNNQDNIVKFLDIVNTFLNDNFLTYEIICVNDASTDDSTNRIKDFINSHNNIKTITILNMSYYQGTEKSMHAGVDLAIGDFVYEFDTTTISYPVEILKEVYSKCLSGFDIISASPKSSHHIQAKCFYKLYNKISNSEYTLKTEAFRILSRRAINRISAMSESTIYRKSAYANCGLKISNIEYDALQEIPHTNFLERSMQCEIAINALILYTDVAYRVSIAFLMLMMTGMIFSGFYSLYMYFIGNSIKGWTTIMLVFSCGLFAIMSILTMLIKYASLILKIVFHKQKYIIESIEKLN